VRKFGLQNFSTAAAFTVLRGETMKRRLTMIGSAALLLALAVPPVIYRRYFRPVRYRRPYYW